MHLTRELILSSPFYIPTLCRITPKIWKGKPTSLPPTATNGIRKKSPKNQTNLKD